MGERMQILTWVTTLVWQERDISAMPTLPGPATVASEMGSGAPGPRDQISVFFRTITPCEGIEPKRFVLREV